MTTTRTFIRLTHEDGGDLYIRPKNIRSLRYLSGGQTVVRYDTADWDRVREPAEDIIALMEQRETT